MPRADDPRVVVRMSGVGYAKVKRAADDAGVGVSGLVRECAEMFAPRVAEMIKRGEITIRRANAPDAVTGPVDVVVPRVLSEADQLMRARQERVNNLGRVSKPAPRSRPR